jgi:hypothetical protein
MVLCGSEDKGDIAVLRASKTPRQSSRLAEKFERHSKRKIDTSDDEEVLFGKMKGRRKLRDPELCPKRRNSISPKNKDFKTAVGSPATSDVSDSGCKTEMNQQSDKYCHFCQVFILIYCLLRRICDVNISDSILFSACQGEYAGLWKYGMHPSVRIIIFIFFSFCFSA